ncbi:YgaC family protein [Nonomuraea sp. NBC_01738]|uniref:DUF402 domain-containing protein n=1 Tax=Nonomuraea sp. NBC_01738 TaxID=2976003 RepID=UPI002E14ABCA|nr:YgaC family protein [Nonomuraea sp. NBC_01738]
MRVVFRKFDGSLHWHHPAERLGEDEHGVWIGCRAGTVGAKGDGPPVLWDLPFVMLFPRDQWWVALFNAEPHRTAIYVDVTTVPEWRDDEVTMVDLDLDVIRKRNGTVFLDDEDEFVEHQVKYAYPAEVIMAAEQAAQELMKAVTEGRGPFDGAHEGWLDAVSSSE